MKRKQKCKLTVGLEPTTSGLEVQCAIQLRHASNYYLFFSSLFQYYLSQTHLYLFLFITSSIDPCL